MKKELKVWAMTCIAFWCLAPNSSKCQDSLSVRALDEVVITADKFPRSSGNTGKVLIVIDSVEMRRSGGKDLSQILGEQAGVYVNGATSNPGKDKAVYLRGASTRQTLIMVDGIPVTDPSGVNGAIDLRLLPIGSVERIEILKGSQSTLYGSGAMGGVINIITKEGVDSSAYMEGLLSYGSYNSLDARLSGGVRLTPWARVTVGLSRMSTSGFSEAKDTLNTGSFDNDAYENTAGFVKLHLTPVKGLIITPYYNLSEVKGDYDAGAFTDDPTAVYSANLQHFGVQSRLETGRSQLSLLIGSTRTDRTFSSEFGTFNAVGNFIQSEAVWKYKLQPNLDVVGGISFQRMSIDDETFPVNHLSSPYVSAHYRGRQLGLEAGIRYNHHSAYGSNWTYSLNPYWRTQKVKIFANLGTGFLAPSLDQLFGQFGPNPELAPEKSVSLEGGVEYITTTFDARVVLFDRKIDDMIIYTSRYENIDQQHVKGIEIEPSWKLNNHFTLSGYYALMDGEVTTETSEGDSTYNDLIRKPAHAFGLTVNWQPLDNLSISTLFRHYGQRDDRFFNLATFTTETVNLEPYSLLDMYVEYQPNTTWSFFINLQNILDEEYEEVYGYNVRRRTISGGLTVSF